MKRMMCVLVLCYAAIRAQGVSSNTSQEVTVWLDDHASVPMPVMVRAQAVAFEMFGRIGVRIQWKAGKPRPDSTSAATGCAKPIVSTIALNTPKSLQPGATAIADLRAGSITVFYDRIQLTVKAWPRLAPVLLAHVLVHEIAHVLQEPAMHSELGVMKALWTAADYHAMEEKPLPFTPLDIDLIRHGVASRVSVSCSESLGPRNP